MSLFEEKKEIPRRELRERLRKAPGRVPGSSRFYVRREREALEKEFGKKYGSYISEPEYKKRLWELRRERYKAKTSAEKLEIDRKIRYLRKLGGIK